MQTFCNTTHEAWEQCVQCVMRICHGDLLYRRKNRPAFYLYFYLRWGWPFFIQKWAMKCWDFVKIKYLCTGNDSCWLPHGSWSPCWRKTRHCCLTLFISLYSGDVCSPILHKFAEKFHLFCWWLTWPCTVWALAGLDSEKKKKKKILLHQLCSGSSCVTRSVSPVWKPASKLAALKRHSEGLSNMLTSAR